MLIDIMSIFKFQLLLVICFNPLPIVIFGSKWIHPDVIDKDESGLSPRKIVTCACFLSVDRTERDCDRSAWKLG